MWSSVLILTAVLSVRIHTYSAHGLSQSCRVLFKFSTIDLIVLSLILEHGEYDLTLREVVNALEKDNTDKIGVGAWFARILAITSPWTVCPIFCMGLEHVEIRLEIELIRTKLEIRVQWSGQIYPYPRVFVSLLLLRRFRSAGRHLPENPVILALQAARLQYCYQWSNKILWYVPPCFALQPFLGLVSNSSQC